jgi:hypothetical protein
MQRGDEDSSSARYYVFMPSDGPEFRVSKRVYSALVDGSYRFYTTPVGEGWSAFSQASPPTRVVGSWR